MGIYDYFSYKYGIRSKGQKRGQAKMKPKDGQKTLCQLREERNKTRNELWRAKKHGLDNQSIRSLANKYHQLLRQHHQIKRMQEKVQTSNHISKERKQCAQNFSRFSKQLLDGDDTQCRIEPAFGSETAESYFRTVYHVDAKTVQQPSWLPDAPQPHHPFNGVLSL